MRKPDDRIVHLLQNVDSGLSVSWNGRVSRWEIWSQRRHLRPSERCKWEPICSFYLNGRLVRISAPKKIDRWHIFFWQGPNGEYRDLTSDIITDVQARDMWKKRSKDIWRELDEEDEAKRALEHRRRKNHFQALASDHPHLRLAHQDVMRNGRYHWIKHHATNFQVGGPFGVRKQKVGK